MLTSHQIKSKAQEMGFPLVGITAARIRPRQTEFYDWWLNQGFAGNMHYLWRQRHARSQLDKILPGVQSVVVVALPFHAAQSELASPTESSETVLPTEPTGRVARYAQGEDYHFSLRRMLTPLQSYIDEHADVPEGTRSLTYVDGGPLPERYLGSQAGIGWIGKNAMLINRGHGSWFWLGEILTTLTLTPDLPITDHCGSCRRCVEACPTDAIIEDLRTIDSRKCISYLTIEQRGAIEPRYHKAIGDWLLGCDICQDVCPWNEHSGTQHRREPNHKMRPIPQERLPLRQFFQMNTKEFKNQYSQRALSRPKLKGLQRNARIVEKNLEIRD